MRRDTKIITIIVFVYYSTYTNLQTSFTGKFENISILMSTAHFEH